jgi:transposase-like protein
MRAHAKEARQRERLFQLGPGGSPDRAIEVVSASVIEVQAKSTPCPVCGGEQRIDEHDAVTIEGTPLRVLRMRCHPCGSKRTLYFKIAAPN